LHLCFFFDLDLCVGDAIDPMHLAFARTALRSHHQLRGVRLAHSSENCHYRTLGLETGASAAEVKRAYLALARATHPDLAPASDAAQATARFQRVSAAFEALRRGHPIQYALVSNRQRYGWVRDRLRRGPPYVPLKVNLGIRASLIALLLLLGALDACEGYAKLVEQGVNPLERGARHAIGSVRAALGRRNAANASPSPPREEVASRRGGGEAHLHGDVGAAPGASDDDAGAGTATKRRITEEGKADADDRIT
jgi:hypothetical protein